jgi:hypothetical protein
MTNLGNSCYVVWAFVEYFSGREHREHLKKQNQAGIQRKVAMEFGNLCSQI